MRTCLLFVASFVSLLGAESSVPDFLRALSQAPAIQAAQERILAARRVAGAAGRLPDPMLGAGYSRKSSTMESWPMYDVALEQPLPRWGERDAMRSKAAAETAMSEAELLDQLGETAAEVAALLADADAARAKVVLVEGQIKRATTVQATVAVRVASGTASIADQLGVKSRLAALAVERDTMQRMVSDAEQDVRGRLGLSVAAPLPLFVAPDCATIVLDRVPGMIAAQARLTEAQAMFREARSSRYPETVVGVRYEREQIPGDPMRTIGVEFRVSLPIWQGASSNLEEAADARQRAAQREVSAWQYRASALLGRAERAATVAASARAAAQDTKSRLDVEYDTMVQAAATQNGTTLISVLDVLDRLSDAERLVIEAEAAARQASANLWRLAPPDLANLNPERTTP